MSYSVSYDDIEKSLSIFSNQMKQLEISRDTLIKETREVISLCSKAIILLHSNKITEAETLLDKSSLLIKNLKNYVIFDLDRYLWPAEQEYVEAFVLKEILERKPILSGYETLNVSINAYVTGLLDCIGEIKRMIYDNLRKNNFDFSLSLFEIMQSIYNLIYPFAFYDNIVSGIRKKLDVSKRIIEDVRITMTEEYQRNTFLTKFQNIVELK
ncbi:MAG: RNA-binding protein [Thermoproteota archaeon]|nr:RNA-binding protein [Thermoproteota archaeon]